ncbi:hypothetical protein DUNSADRAFT_7241 [Dunaliella salina]|uniref:Uncharacterized protein n=1 Tax=Dunaliella salina TaxID=3046 RepID=A0ABQ7GLT7_DUNSA|nr:hypothetical protein DUNSADRAFT_7241 [Dunaliella salina]|eukprot:KAF5835542.1 hypothetical protein DUNSADRAFT_7241 [Dunaliella salina]
MLFWKAWGASVGLHHYYPRVPVRAMSTSRYPPPLADDSNESVLDFMLERLRMLWGPLQDTFGPMLSLIGPELKQVLWLCVTIGVILLLHAASGRMQA